jgi:hypothetical protein
MLTLILTEHYSVPTTKNSISMTIKILNVAHEHKKGVENDYSSGNKKGCRGHGNPKFWYR